MIAEITLALTLAGVILVIVLHVRSDRRVRKTEARILEHIRRAEERWPT